MIQSTLLKLIRGYQFVISPSLGSSCRFTPSCSQYASEAILKYGVTYGSWLSIKRLLRCSPLHSGGYDPLP